jgi:large subunit ribosomal protein L29
VANKRMKELKNLSKDELNSKVRELEETLFRDRMKRVTGQLENTSIVWKNRKDLARVKTLLTQKTAGQKTAPTKSASAQK